MSGMGGHMLHRLSDVKPPEKGQYITLELSNDKDVVKFEAGHLIPADSDWRVILYRKELGFCELDFDGNEQFYTPHYWDYMPFL